MRKKLNQTYEDIDDFLQGILTEKEREEIPIRLEIIKQLKKGVPQREIAKDLNIGIATITRGSKELKNKKFLNI